MPISPLTEDTTIFTFRILVDGNQLDDSLNVLKIEVNSKMGEIPSATVTFSFQAGSALMAAMEELAPGKNTEIKMGYSGQDQLVFSGIITDQSVESTEGQRLILSVNCHDKALALDQVLDKQLFSDLTDTEIISTIVNESGLPLDVDNTNVRHQRLSQFQMTDWGFIQARAKANNLLAYAENGTVFVKASAPTSEPALVLTLSKDVIAFNLSNKANDLPNPRIGARSSAPTTTVVGALTFSGNATPRLNSTIKLAGFGEQFKAIGIPFAPIII